MTGSIRVVIADDHAPTRDLVSDALTAQGFEVVADVGSAPEAVSAAQEHEPDVCLVDLHMPGDGLVAVRRIVDKVPETNVVVFTVSRADEHLFEALSAGAIGYLLKDLDPDHLGEALHGALRGEAAIPKRMVTKLVSEFRRSRKRRLPLIGGRKVEFTDKEWDVLDGLREGRTTKQIAEQLSVSPVTVRSHVASIVRKLRVSDRDEAVALLEEL